MSNNNVDPKITDRMAKEFSKAIESGELYEELKNKDSEKNENDKDDNKKRKSK